MTGVNARGSLKATYRYPMGKGAELHRAKRTVLLNTVAWVAGVEPGRGWGVGEQG